jgi:hypothetical protein
VAQDSFWFTRRDGNWSRPIEYHDSPWFTSDSDAVGDEGFVPGDGDTVIVAHNLTVDVDTKIGLSIASAIWQPLTISVNGPGDLVTDLGSGTYTLAASVVGGRGETTVGNTVSAPFTLSNGISKPRVTFARKPPQGGSYNIYLDSPANPGVRRLYCSSIIEGGSGTTCDLITGKWNGQFTSGNAMNGLSQYEDVDGPIPSGRASAITITSGGSLAVMPGKVLLVRGDLIVESPTGSIKPYILVGAGASFRSDSSHASDLSWSDYLVWFQGGGDVRFLG